jgi:N-acetylglucosaminyltransferase
VIYLIYLAIVVPYSLLQTGFATTVTRGREGASPEPAEPIRPAVDVVITCYNEDPQLFAECCASVAAQDYGGSMQIYIVDDGSANAEALQAALVGVKKRHPERRWTVEFATRRANKRAAQDVVFGRCSGEVIVTVDSDTVLEPDAVTSIVQPFRDPAVGAVCGHLRARNADQNLLTGLINRRYKHIFEQERAAQGRFGTTLCCAGPLSAYRRSVLLRVWDRYLGQTFLGVRCIAGDDIHLTVLVLEQGFKTVFEPRALAHTQVPPTLELYCRQQLRWQRSMYRELAWMVPLLRRWHPFVTLDLVARTLLPFLLVALAALFTAEVVLIDPAYLREDWYLLLVPMVVNAGLVAWQVRDLRFLAYGPLHLLLTTFRLYAVVSLASSNWMTRSRR